MQKLSDVQLSRLKHIAKITAVLMIITTVTAVLLACINLLTEPVILKNEAKAKQEAIMALFPEATAADSLMEDLGDRFPEGISDLFAVYGGEGLLGFCADAHSMGFSDYIGMMVGVNADNTVRGVKIMSISDTPGLGLEVTDPDYLATYRGVSGPLAFGRQVDAVSGATYSSRGILNGVNEVLAFCALIEVTVPENDTPTPEETEPTDTVTAAESGDETEPPIAEAPPTESETGDTTSGDTGATTADIPETEASVNTDTEEVSDNA